MGKTNEAGKKGGASFLSEPGRRAPSLSNPLGTGRRTSQVGGSRSTIVSQLRPRCHRTPTSTHFVDGGEILPELPDVHSLAVRGSVPEHDLSAFAGQGFRRVLVRSVGGVERDYRRVEGG